MYSLVDFKTKKPVTPDSMVFTGSNGPWEVVMDLKKCAKHINEEYFRKSPPYASKYLPLMPVKDHSTFSSLGAGATPLIPSIKIGPELGIDLYFKLENQNPTGSFKDRGSAVEISVARELGANGIVLASTGNMAASCSCYAANAGIPCFVFVPEGTPPSKLAQVIAYGGKVVQVRGSYGDAARLAEEAAREWNYYLAGDYAFRVEGHKTAAFELIDQLFFRPPHFVIVPMGCGTNIASYHKGFAEYHALGYLHRIPKLIGVQAAGASTIVSAFEQGLEDAITLDSVQSVAKAICINHALDGSKALAALYQTEGAGYALGDQEMLEAQYRLSREEGIFVEPSCGSTVASLVQLAKQYDLKGKRIVCVLPGTGLKDPTAILKIAIKPPTIHPNLEQFRLLHEHKFFEGSNVSFFDKNEVLFKEIPSTEAISVAAEKYLKVRYAEKHLQRFLTLIENILSKGKSITFSDFQDIAQEVLESPDTEHSSRLQVVDFEVQVRRNKPAEARVTVEVGGQQLHASSAGTGPVDAVLTAISSSLPADLGVELLEYRPVIRSQGPEAVVFVEMQLRRAGVSAIGSGTSPDIVQASIEAYVESFNALG